MAGEDDSYTEGTLSTEVAPATRPRDQGGKFIRESRAPEQMFSLRPVEGDPETGDTSDGGEDRVLRSRERNVADGREEQTQQTTRKNGRQDGERRRADGEIRNDADADDGHELLDEEPEHLTTERESEAADGEDGEDDAGQKYEVMVDGEPKEVTLDEALAGYVRTETFHKRMNDLNGIQHNMELEADRLSKGWAAWNQAKAEYEQDLFALIPQEPDWDKEFAANPTQAHANQKIYQTLYKKLADSRAQRGAVQAQEAEATEKRLAKYATDGINAFYLKHKKLFPNKETYDKNIASMRRTAVDAGFSEPEVATVFDPRMLTVLLWASKFRRIVAAQIRPEQPGKGRTLPPGAATPRIGNAPRKGLDEAQKRLQSSGKLDDAADVFSRILQRG